MSFKTLIFAILFFCPPVVKPWLLRVFCGAQLGRHVKIGWFASVMGRHIALGDYSEVRAFTLIKCDGDLVLGPYAIVSSFNLIYGAAGFFVGEHSYIGPQCLINTDEDVRLGRWSALGARCMVYTHGSFLPYTEGYWVRFGAVTLGDYVWCAAGVFLQPGSEIGSHSFVNSRSVVGGSLPPGTIAEGNPARPVGEMERMRRTMSPRRVDAAAAHMLRHFSELMLTGIMSLPVETERTGAVRFRHGKKIYRLAIATSIGPTPTITADGSTTIWLVTRPHWRPADSSHWLDLTNNRMTSDRDPIYVELALFLKRYYGVQLAYAEEE
ncbi:acyltransferase [Candidatus Chloroploca asiatica]|uniref:Transferase n=1 Tax=Candidatus Chloroploca asiatica TaxID=1506545 RepID=A0A2H3KVR0_9CHLR|nr:transferase [Candidatus Chloroploca asiatica]PDV96441.1 transferase [Candidatus Chloroploca asiatica]